MANSLFQQINNTMPPFVKFMNQMRGKNPNEILQNMITSGQVNQAQLNQAQQIANSKMGMFDGFKKMFGF